MSAARATSPVRSKPSAPSATGQGVRDPEMGKGDVLGERWINKVVKAQSLGESTLWGLTPRSAQKAVVAQNTCMGVANTDLIVSSSKNGLKNARAHALMCVCIYVRIPGGMQRASLLPGEGTCPLCCVW